MARILVAEDEKDIRELIALTLQFNGFDVVGVIDGAEAVRVATQEPDIDVILMDVRMPRMTGYDACRILKEQEETRHIPVIFLSAKGQETEVQAGLQVGAVQYILKPFAPDALIRILREVLGRS